MDRWRTRGRWCLEAFTSSSQVKARSPNVLNQHSRTTEQASSSASHIRETRNILAEAVSRLDVYPILPPLTFLKVLISIRVFVSRLTQPKG